MPLGPLAVLREENWTIGNCVVLPYDRKQESLFGRHYLRELYDKCAGQNPSQSILPDLFCGMTTDLSADAVCSYLSTKPILLLMIKSDDGQLLYSAGLAFPVTIAGPSTGLRSAFYGYGFFREYWGLPEISVLAMLGLGHIFVNNNLIAIHGTRYADNHLSAQFMSKFGFKDVGMIEHYMLDREGKELTSAKVNTLKRGDFVAYVEKELKAVGMMADDKSNPDILAESD